LTTTIWVSTLRLDTLPLSKRLGQKSVICTRMQKRPELTILVSDRDFPLVREVDAKLVALARAKPETLTYGSGGHVYVFFVYGMYYQLNVVTGPADHPHVVLIRAIEPVDGVEIMRERRGKMPDKNLTSGPGKLCIALNIDRSLNGDDLCGGRIWLEDHCLFADDEIAAGKRIGIDYAGDDVANPWRFWVKDNSFVSKR